MRTIFYSSNLQPLIFPLNSRSNFESYIPPRYLSYIANQEIEVAIKSITFDNSREIDLKHEQTLALKSNLSYDTISSCGWDKIVSIFTVSPRDRGAKQIKFPNPSFFAANRYNLGRATFKIIDLNTGDLPNFSSGSPTFIEVLVRSRAKRMKQPFHMFLDSSCKESMKRFPNNNNTDFCIQLPQRMDFQKDWVVCMKSIHLSTKVSPLNKCIITMRGTMSNGSKWETTGGFLEKTNLKRRKIIKELNVITKGFLDFFENAAGTLYFRRNIEYEPKEYGEKFNLEFSPAMQRILGLSDSQRKMEVNDKTLITMKKMNIFALTPAQYIVCCDLVQESILGGQHVQVLKYFTRNPVTNEDIDVEFIHNDYLKLNLKNFDRIHIRISDLSGETIHPDPDIATRILLLFVNTNTQ